MHDPIRDEPPPRLAVWLLAGYLLLIAISAAWLMVSIFPGLDAGTDTVVFGTPSLFWIAGESPIRTEPGLLLLAICAGLLGSFVHAAQSLAAFVGNQRFRTRWILWYLIRPPIGAILGLLFYVVVRAGLLSTDGSVTSPFGVVALAGLGGWFSKQATNKLAEVFDVLFRTQDRTEYEDGLDSGPQIVSITPAPIPTTTAIAGKLTVRIQARGLAGVRGVNIGAATIEPDAVNGDVITLTMPEKTRKRFAGSTQDVTIVGPPPENQRSQPAPLEFTAEA